MDFNPKEIQEMDYTQQIYVWHPTKRSFSGINSDLIICMESAKFQKSFFTF